MINNLGIPLSEQQINFGVLQIDTENFATGVNHPETNGKIECLNQIAITRLKCKVKSSSSKISWPKLLNEVLNQHNSIPHSVTKF